MPEYRNNKIGTKLLQDCFERALELGAEKVKSGIVKGNLRHTSRKILNIIKFKTYVSKTLYFLRILGIIESKIQEVHYG